MRRRVLVLLVALVLAVMSGIAVLSYARSADRRAVSGNEGVWVVVAKQRIPAETTGAQVKTLIDRILVPAETVPQGALTEWDPKLDASQLTVTLEPSQLVMRPLFQSAKEAAERRRLSVPTGRLAVTVALSIAPQVAGDVTAGDKVAVYGTCPASGKVEEQRTQVLLTGATVATIGEAPMPTASATTPPPVAGASAEPTPTAESTTAAADRTERYVVTLVVDDADAPRLVHASRTCLLYLAMLGPSTVVTPGRPIDVNELFP